MMLNESYDIAEVQGNCLLGYQEADAESNNFQV